MPLSLALAGHDIDGDNAVLLSTETPVASSSPPSGRVCVGTPEGRILPTEHEEQRVMEVLQGSSEHDAGGGEGTKRTSGDKEDMDDISLVSSRRRATNRICIAELLVDKGARCTWRRTPNELNKAVLDENNHASMVERGGDDNTETGGDRMLCNFRG